MQQHFDCAVIGTGGIGSAALYEAARRGWSVIGIDRFAPAHDRGSSHGQTRIIRQAYFEHPDYVPLVLDSYTAWAAIEQESGESLLEQTGLLQVGHPGGPVIEGVLRSSREHGLAVESLSVPQMESRFPGFRYPADSIGVYEPVAGFLRVETCVRTLIRLAVRQGAHLAEPDPVQGWQTGDDGRHRLSTRSGRVLVADRLIVTAGPWAPGLLSDHVPELRIIAKHQHWFDCHQPRLAREAGCPVFFFETDEGYFYGFPDFDGRGNKLAEHSGGHPVSDPTTVDRNPDPGDLQRVSRFLTRHLLASHPRHSGHSVCMYTMSPDEHFIVDTIDPSGTIAVACGMSGHGFKFAPVLGQALVDMLDGRFRPDMEFLRLTRFAAGNRSADLTP